MLREALEIEEVGFTLTPVFVSHEYVQPAGSDWCGEHCVWYYSYAVPKIHDLPDAMSFAYGDSFALGSEKPWHIYKRGGTSRAVTRMEML